MGISIRAARQDDSNMIAAICQTALGYDCDLTLVTAQLARIQLRESERVWVACDERTQRIMGFIHLADYETLFSGSMKNIIALAVSPADQGKGIGRLLIQTAEEWAWKNGCVGVRLESGFARVKAHAFYLHCGYRLRKEHKNFIKERQTEVIAE